MFGSTNNKTQYNFETTSTTPFQQQLHNESTRTPNTALNNLIGRKLIDTSLYSTDYSTTEDASVFYTPHSNLGGQQADMLKKNSCPQNPPISNTTKFAQAPFGSFNNELRGQFKSSSQINNHTQTSGNNSLLRRAISQKYSPNVAANTVTFISNNTTASTEDLEDDCFGSPTTPSSYHQQYEVMTSDSATPVSKLSTSTISKKSPLLTDDYSSHQSTNKSTTGCNTLSSGRTKSSEALSSTKSSWSKPKACHSFKIDNPFLNDKSHLNENYSCSYVREDNFMANHHFNRHNTSGHCNNREKKAIFELSVNEEDLRILEEGIPYQNNSSSNTTWFNTTIQPQQFSNKEETIKPVNPISPPFLNSPQRDHQGNFTKSQIETDKSYNNISKSSTSKDSARYLSIIDHQHTIASTNYENNKLEKIHTDHCDPSHQIDTARCVPKNSTFEINLDGSRSCTSSNDKLQDFKSCMAEVQESAKFQPEKKQTSSQGTTSAVFCSSIITHTAAETGIENNPLLDDCTFLPSPILPKESVRSNNTSTLHIIDHSLLFRDDQEEEETKSIEKTTLVKPDINSRESTQGDKMLKQFPSEMI